MQTKSSLRARLSRFLDERYAHREQPGYFVDLFLWGLIVIIATWPLLSLAMAMELVR
jgi:hypothetical protein